MAQLTKSCAQLLTHDNYSVTTSPDTKTLPFRSNFLFIENMDSVNSLLVSFDSGTTFKTILANRSLSVDMDSIASYQIKSSAGTPLVECLYGSEQ